MIVQAEKELDRPPFALPVRQAYPITETVAGFGGARLVGAVSGSAGMVVVVGYGLSSNATREVLWGAVCASNNEYDPGFVARVLRVDAAPAEATFDNIVDLMDWLERD